VAFADPMYPTDTDVVKAYGLEPLPATRDEARRIVALYPAGRAVAYLGAEATEARATTLGRGARYLHFATHALTDDRVPLDSSLVLTLPRETHEGTPNGRLQAWEIFERVRLDADLVTLSGCRTGLGAERGGEGLVGLARAFQFAGARSVVASQWAVSDRSTAELMVRFYDALNRGAAKDEALQIAQRASIHGIPPSSGAPDTRHPFRWAAFELIGDWR
jgi:CHAT domain-containing protein